MNQYQVTRCIVPAVDASKNVMRMPSSFLRYPLIADRAKTLLINPQSNQLLATSQGG
jgi:hypothetical protein